MDNKAQTIKKFLRLLLFALIGGFLFALLDRAGYMLANYQTIWAVSENPLHKTLIHRILCRLPFYTLIIFALLSVLPVITERLQKIRPLKEKRYQFFLFWGIIFLSWIPAFLATYPGIFAADAPNQIGWFNHGSFTSHHPIIHTLMLVGFWNFGKNILDSQNLGIALYCIFQMLVLSGCYAHILRWLQKRKVSYIIWGAAMIFFTLHPYHAILSVFTTKDVLFAGFFAVFLTRVIDLFLNPASIKERKVFFQFLLWLFLSLIFRNNMLYAWIVFIPFVVFFLRRYWKYAAALIAGTFVLYGLYMGPVHKLAGAEKGDAREAYSVIIQTLARTYSWGENHLTEPELEIIRPVLSDEALGYYMTTLSDPVKCMFCTENFNENRSEFLRTWLWIGKREYQRYTDAFLATTYQFWAIQSSEILMTDCINYNPDDELYPHIIQKPFSKTLNSYYKRMSEASGEEPFALAVFFKSALYVWFSVFVFLYLFYRKNYPAVCYLMIPALYFLTFFLGPRADFRYFYAIFAVMPVFLAVLTEPLRLRTEGETAEGLEI